MVQGMKLTESRKTAGQPLPPVPTSACHSRLCSKVVARTPCGLMAIAEGRNSRRINLGNGLADVQLDHVAMLLLLCRADQLLGRVKLASSTRPGTKKRRNSWGSATRRHKILGTSATERSFGMRGHLSSTARAARACLAEFAIWERKSQRVRVYFIVGEGTSVSLPTVFGVSVFPVRMHGWYRE